MEDLQGYGPWLLKKPQDLQRQYTHPSEVLPSQYWENRSKEQLLMWAQISLNAVAFNETIYDAIIGASDFDEDCSFFDYLDIDQELEYLLEIAEMSTMELLELSQWVLSLATEKYQLDIEKN